MASGVRRRCWRRWGRKKVAVCFVCLCACCLCVCVWLCEIEIAAVQGGVCVCVCLLFLTFSSRSFFQKGSTTNKAKDGTASGTRSKVCCCCCCCCCERACVCCVRVFVCVCVRKVNVVYSVGVRCDARVKRQRCDGWMLDDGGKTLGVLS